MGLAPGASAAELRRARNELAKRLHPDRSGAPSEAMAAVNAAYEAAAAARQGEATFSLDVLPVEAFEVVAVAVAAAGEVLDADEPYALDGYLAEPGPCFCRFDLGDEPIGKATNEHSACLGGPRPPRRTTARGG